MEGPKAIRRFVELHEERKRLETRLDEINFEIETVLLDPVDDFLAEMSVRFLKQDDSDYYVDVERDLQPRQRATSAVAAEAVKNIDGLSQKVGLSIPVQSVKGYLRDLALHQAHPDRGYILAGDAVAVRKFIQAEFFDGYWIDETRKLRAGKSKPAHK